MSQATEHLSYSVPGIGCGHCVAAITAAVKKLPGVIAVDFDLSAKHVSVAGEGLDDPAIRASIYGAGYDVG